MQKKDFTAGAAQLPKHMIPLDAQGSKECVFYLGGLQWMLISKTEIKEKHDLYCYLFCTYCLQNQLSLWSFVNGRIKLSHFFVSYFCL